MKNGVFWNVTPFGSCKNWRFGETRVSFIRVTRVGELGTTLAVTSNRRTHRASTKLVCKNLECSESKGTKITRFSRIFLYGLNFSNLFCLCGDSCEIPVSILFVLSEISCITDVLCIPEWFQINTILQFEEWCLLGCYAVWLCKNRRFGGL
jgi:hypothetical protein